MPDNDDSVQDPDDELASSSHHVHDVVTSLAARRKPTDQDVANHPSTGPANSVDEATLRTIRDRLEKKADTDPDPDPPLAS